MDTTEIEVIGFVGKELHEFAWKKGYPFHPGAGLDAFFEGLRDCEFNVEPDDSLRKAWFSKSFRVGEKTYQLGTQMSYSSILTGWARNKDAKGSARRYYESIFQLFDNLGEFFDEQYGKFSQEKAQWATLRDSEPRRIRNAMEKHLLESFREHQENMFMSVDGELPDLREFSLVRDVIPAWPVVRLLKQSDRNSFYAPNEYGFKCGPTEETLYEIDLGELEVGSYFPSESTILGVFWGRYLAQLAKLKGYPLNYPEEDIEEACVRAQEGALKEAGSIPWKYHASFGFTD